VSGETGEEGCPLVPLRTLEYVRIIFFKMLITLFLVVLFFSSLLSPTAYCRGILLLPPLGTLPPAVSTQQLVIDDMCKICGLFPNTAEKGLKKKYQKVLNDLKCCHILKAYFLLVILIYNNHKFDQNMCSEQYRDCCTYFKVRMGCTRRSIRPFMKFYFYPLRQCGRIGKKGKKAKTDKTGKLW
jgi:hypothetical protein